MNAKDPAPRPLDDGPLAIDLLNTRWGAGEHETDWLDLPAAAGAFTTAYGVVVPAADVETARSRLLAARDLVERVFDAARANDLDDNELADDIDATLAHSRAFVTPGDRGPEVSISSDDATNALPVQAVVNAIDLVRDKPDRIRSCEHDQCTLWFLDTSKGGRRRWCSMDTCGNRAKAARHYDRTKSN